MGLRRLLSQGSAAWTEHHLTAVYLQGAGFGALVYGVALLSVPAAWILAGTMILAYGALKEITDGPRHKDQASD